MDPVARVLAFHTAFAQAHAQTTEGSSGDRVDFDLWRRHVLRLDEEHFAHGQGRELAHSFGSPPRYRPDAEEVTGVETSGATASVDTTATSPSPHWRQYHLVLLGGDWRITRISEFFDPPNAPFVAEVHRAEFLDPPAGELREAVEVVDPLLFQDGRAVTVEGHHSTIRVVDVGSMSIPSGVLVAGDFGYDSHLLTAMVRRVPPGRYPVQVAITFGRNTALRIKVSDREVVSWHPADDAGGGHVMGVDAGNIALLDAAGLVSLTVRRKESLYDDWARSEDHPATQLLALAPAHDGVIAASGFGDGAYPAYWGLDAEGEPAVLLVDFLVLRGAT